MEVVIARGRRRQPSPQGPAHRLPDRPQPSTHPHTAPGPHHTVTVSSNIGMLMFSRMVFAFFYNFGNKKKDKNRQINWEKSSSPEKQ